MINPTVPGVLECCAVIGLKSKERQNIISLYIILCSNAVDSIINVPEHRFLKESGSNTIRSYKVNSIRQLDTTTDCAIIRN